MRWTLWGKSREQKGKDEYRRATAAFSLLVGKENEGEKRKGSEWLHPPDNRQLMLLAYSGAKQFSVHGIT